MSNVGKKSQVKLNVERYRDLILKGHMLVIDPSTGSGSSLPGFAIYTNGKLLQCGVIQVNVSAAKNKRLFEIRRTLQEEFEVPDILIIEHISAVPWGNMRYNAEALAGLQRGVGAILSAFNVDAVIEVPPAVWKKTVDDKYKKSDEADAVYMGRYVILEAKGELGDEADDTIPKFTKKKRKYKKWPVKTTRKKKKHKRSSRRKY